MISVDIELNSYEILDTDAIRDIRLVEWKRFISNYRYHLRYVITIIGYTYKIEKYKKIYRNLVSIVDKIRKVQSNQ